MRSTSAEAPRWELARQNWVTPRPCRWLGNQGPEGGGWQRWSRGWGEKVKRGQDLCGLHAPTLQPESSWLLGGSLPFPSQAAPAVSGAAAVPVPMFNYKRHFCPHLIMQPTPVDLQPSVPTSWPGMMGPSDCPRGPSPAWPWHCHCSWPSPASPPQGKDREGLV